MIKEESKFIKILNALINDELKVKDISLLKSIVLSSIYIVMPHLVTFVFVEGLNTIKTDLSVAVLLAIITIVTTISTMFVIIISAKILKNSKVSIVKEHYNIIRKRDVINVLFIMLGFILIRQSILYNFLIKFEGPISNESIDFISNNLNPIELSITVLILIMQMIVIAPIFEELFFRGIIFNGILSRYKRNYKKAIIISGIIFGVAHMNIPQGINATIAGIILCVIYYYTNCIKIAIFAHFLNNFLIFLPTPNTILIKISYIIIGAYLLSKGIRQLKERIRYEE